MSGVQLDVSDRTVVVAGAGGDGIGTGISALLVRSGATVLGLDVDRDALALTERAVGDDATARFVPVIADATDPAAVDRALGALDVLPPLHGLVHVVGGMPFTDWSTITAMPPERFAEVVALNLQSAFVTTQAVARRLVDGHARSGGGSIVLISSISGTQAMPFGAPYAAAKAGILALVRTAALELGPLGVRVNAVAPGTIRTAHSEQGTPSVDTIEEQLAIPLRRRGTPGDIAGAVLYLLSDLAAFVTGHTLVVDGGSSARPSFLDAENVPVFVRSADLRARLLQPGDPLA
ncbi:MAG TPA: SDR family NAD(P)-dependent oxidoreductase [Acidimicrobiia bacterium]|nr:SDR family NAD(P)-dependent oxidoreductase [Acidimicrobiia bacterium]